MLDGGSLVKHSSGKLKSITFGAESPEKDSQKAFVNSEYTGSYQLDPKEMQPSHGLIAPPQAGDIPDWSVQVVQSLLTSLKTVDDLTYYHCLRVGQTSGALAKAAGLSVYQQKVAEFAGMLHDVGKMGIDKSILHKPTRLNESEYHAMMAHPVMSEKIIKPFGNHSFFHHLIPAVRNHHEWVNGTGYPDKLSGDNIPLVSRIILIVDTLDAMSMSRSYRKGLSIDLIYAEIKKYAGEQFDEQIVKVFLDSHRFWSKDLQDPEKLEESVLRRRAA